MNKIAIPILLAFIWFFLAFSTRTNSALKQAKKVLDGFCALVPSGNAVIAEDTISVQAFYMSKTEITNAQYREFLNALKQKGDSATLSLAQIDSNAWRNPRNFSEPYASYYHSHPAYDNYPVVNITVQGAERYCAWLSDYYDSISNGTLKLIFRIPTQAEWIRAARGDEHHKQFAWTGNSIHNENGQKRANFLTIGEQNITRDSATNQLKLVSREQYFFEGPFAGNDIIAPAKSYWPNEFGFYNLNGNVSEMIADRNRSIGGCWNAPGFDIRNESLMRYDGPDPRVGFRVVASVVRP